MKLSFSTRGWKNLKWNELTDIAEDMRFSGIELYKLKEEEGFFERGCPLDKYSVAATMRELRDRNISIPVLDTAVELAEDSCIEELTWYMEMAATMRVGMVGAVALIDDEESIKRNISKLSEICERTGVKLAIKTTGIYADTARLRALLDSFASDNLVVTWDMHHPYYDLKESADTTIKNLGAYVKHVHLRDSSEDGSYTIIGEGTLPVE